jgi:hypothetical protein
VTTITQIQRDPFARGSIVRRTLTARDRRPCDWCGQPGRFQYGWEDDQNRPISWTSGIYCSVDCHRTDDRR